MKVIIFGANGQLGADIKEVFNRNYEVLPITHDIIDIENLAGIKQLIEKERPHILINTTAYHQVDLCEQNIYKARSINSISPEYMAHLCAEHQIKFIHFSTDYVFDGKTHRPYIETDTPHPLNNYGLTKYEGEKNILEVNPDAIVIRISAIYGSHPCRAKNGLNFVQLMLKLAHEKGEVKVVDDEIISPTYTKNIANQLVPIISSPIKGIVHCTSEGQCSWYDFAEEIFRYTETTVKLYKANSNDFPSKVIRPKYSVLENDLLKKYDINMMPDWKTALYQYLDSI